MQKIVNKYYKNSTLVRGLGCIALSFLSCYFIWADMPTLCQEVINYMNEVGNV